jgi:hypothetical protein
MRSTKNENTANDHQGRMPGQLPTESDAGGDYDYETVWQKKEEHPLLISLSL